MKQTLLKKKITVVLVILIVIPLFSEAKSLSTASLFENVISYQTSDLEAPTAPTNARAYQTFATSCNIQWVSSSDNVGVVSYEIYNGSVLIGTSKQYEPYFQIKGLTELTTYTFSVKAKDAAGNTSLSSNLIIITTPDGTTPTSPTNLTATDITATSVNLSWSGSTDNIGVTGYSIYNNTFTLLGTVDGSTKTFNVKDLKQATTYNFSIKATDAAGNSSLESNIVIVKALDIIAPTVPTSLVASEITKTSLNLSWNASTDSEGVIGYDIYQGQNLLVASTTKTSYTVTGLTSNNFYSYSVKARDAAGNTSNATLSIVCETLDAISPTAPTSLIASEISDTSANLSWNASTDNKIVAGYKIYNGNDFIASSTATSFKISGLTPNTIYNFSVKGIDVQENISTESNTITVTTLQQIPAYCVSVGFSQVLAMLITRVKIGSIDYSGNTSNNHYSDNTNLSTDLKKGEVSLITIKPREKFKGQTEFGQRYAVWIDYNGDKDFYDAGEMVWNQIVTKESPVVGTFVVPETAITGTTRMRVIIRDDAVGIPYPCGDYTGTYNYGETEDYTINILNNITSINGPNAPTNLTASETSPSTTNLSWAGPVNNSNISNYEIYQESVLIGTSATTNFIVNGLSQATSYLFTVKSKNTNGDLSVSSVPVIIKTLTDAPPTVPTALTTSDITPTKVTLSWNPSTNNAGGIKYKITQNSAFVAFVSVPTYTVSHLINNTNYSFQVEAIDSEAQSSIKSNAVLVKTLIDNVLPTAPTNLRANNTTTISTTLSWDKATDDQYIKSYSIYNGAILIANVDESITSYDIKNLKEGTAYLFTVKAYDSGSNEKTSNALTVSTITLPKYCIPGSTAQNNDTISNVTLGKINNSASELGAVQMYNDFKSTGGFVIPGQENTISITVSKYYSGTKPSGLAFWIDLNGDKDFDDAGELIYSTTITAQSFTAIKKFTIPITATAGRSKMRIALKENGIPAPCEMFHNGEIEDYILDIKDPIIEYEAPTAPLNLVASNTTASTTELSWASSTDNIAVTEYEIYEGITLIGTTTLTNFTVKLLSAKTGYSFSIKAKDYAQNISQASNAVSVTTLPADLTVPSAPLNLTASDITKTAINLLWNASTDNIGVTGYNIYKENTIIGTTSSTNFAVTGLTLGTKYSFSVKAKDEAGNISASSNQISITTLSLDVIPPTAPTNLVATNTTKNGTTLSWMAATDNVGVTGYNIYYLDTILFASTTNTTYIFTNLIDEKRYSFTVKAKDADGNLSDASKNVIVDTLPEDSTPPTAPTNLKAVETTSTATTLSWTPSTDNIGVTSYEIYHDTWLIGSTSTTTYTINNLTSEKEYSFSVKAKDRVKNLSEASNIIKVTPPRAIAYCTSAGTDTEKGHINNVHLNTINNTTKGEAGGYSDFTAISTNLTKGATNTITVETYTSYNNSNVFAVWIDLNADNDFLDDNELVWTSATVTSQSVTGNFIIPNTAINGTTRMRVSMKRNGTQSPCEIFALGEVEDYTVNIQNNLSVQDHDISKNNFYQLYPNPVHEKLFVKLTENTTSFFKITNVAGQTIKEGIINETGLDVSKIGSGIYIIELNDGEKSVFRKFIKY
ncbi:fibronectin type III domain-containing protein [Flavobacterium sp. Root420]|uniref:fibronectin type III domain-containing protein n=1 Tax=Flavobacterium sp. Root420 TaxID=1736533 RepID=UPI0006FF15F5|nr:fibronectin type III domain-containing protein [Flavobacterium sp. Root420]KQX13003.1 hypothetical protein ASC72_19550 [Flavobacterium sp. Root420]